jgi:hypothetical protein
MGTMANIFKCRAYIAGVIFVTLCMVASAVHLFKANPTQYPYHSWTSWAIDDFLARKERPDIVFMGSSLMLVPLSGVDADYLNAKIDGAGHHNSVYFEQKFNEATGTKPTTFNFALPGEMPSDAYLITDFLLKDKNRPDVIVYGVGPRDFMDNLLPSASATDPYRFLSRFGDISHIASMAMPEWVERFNYELGKTFYIYGQRGEVCTQLNVVAKNVINNIFPAPEKLMPRHLVHQMMPEYQPFQLEKEEAFFRPITDAELASFTDNLQEYRKRYKKLNWKTFLTQMQFLTQSASTARQRGTHVVIVAMPITDLNRELISDQTWQLYRNSVKGVATATGASFVDFSESPCFNRKDFSDTVRTQIPRRAD